MSLHTQSGLCERVARAQGSQLSIQYSVWFVVRDGLTRFGTSAHAPDSGVVACYIGGREVIEEEAV